MLADSEKGNAAAAEKSFTSRFTLSSTWGCGSPAFLSEIRPPVILTSFTERSGGAAVDGGVAGAGAEDFPPRLEKFHAPEADWIKEISGPSISTPVTLSFLETMR